MAAMPPMADNTNGLLEISSLSGWKLLWPFPYYGKRQWLAASALFLAYLIAAQIGFHLYTAPAVIVPGAGIALAILLLEGVLLWPAVMAALIIHYVVIGATPVTLMLLTLGNTLTPAVAAYFLHRLGFGGYMRRLRDMLLFLTVVPLAAVIAPSLGMLALFLNTTLYGRPPSSVGWVLWWIGVMTSIILLTPLIVRWAIKPQFNRSRREIFELVGAFAFLIAIATLLYWTPYNTIYGISLVYFLLLPLFWMALRSGPRFLSVMLFVLAVIGVTGTYWTHMGDATLAAELGESLYQRGILFNILAVLFYVIASIEEERKEALRAVSRQISRLEAVLGEIEGESRAKTDFLAMLAHELRNPLAPVVSSIELMRLRNQVNEEGREVLDVMESSVKVMRRLLDDLLDISRITQQKITLQKEPFHVGFVARRAIKNLEKRFQEERQTLLLDLPKVPLMIEADPVRIEQAMTNLLGNASKFTPKGGTISLFVRQHGGMAEIHIKDSGIGIDPSMLQRIFEPFMQLERGHQGQEGLGIGLALTQKIIEIHGGTIQARSEGKGKGSEFIVRLPIAFTTRISDSEFAIPPLQESNPQRPRNILVVDDNVPAAHAIGALLRHDGHTVDYATSGAETKDKLKKMNPDVLIMDIGLPDTNGYDLAKALRSEGFDGLLIALTGYGLDDDKKHAIESGFNVHLTKPIAMRDLRQTLGTI